MKTKQPIPEDNDNAAEEASQEGETMAMVKQFKAASKRWTPTRKQIGVGAAIGVGSAAVVAALLYWRGNKR